MSLTPQDALNVVLERVRSLVTVHAPLGQAAGCCLAQDVRADRDLPATDRSAMDGYAVRSKDTRRPRGPLRLIGEVAAGSGRRPRVVPGTCARVLTGASIPPGADTVIRQEDTKLKGHHVTCAVTVPVGENIRRRGEEARKGEVLLGRGTLLGAAQIGLCASVGLATVRVHRRPRLSVLCTGGELRPVGKKVSPFQLRDSNGPALLAAMCLAGLSEVQHRIVPDDPAALAAELAAATRACDLVVVTGGVSVGKYDFVPEVLRRIGAKVQFRGVSMKPGKPHLFATLPGNRYVLGLPGNPLSVLVGFHWFVLPAIRRLSGLPAAQCRRALPATLVRSVRADDSRTEFVQARLTWGQEGPRITAVPRHGSADLVAGARSDGVFPVPAGAGRLPAGRRVEFIPWKPIL
jgi:molybdopterin molybdotransferase